MRINTFIGAGLLLLTITGCEEIMDLRFTGDSGRTLVVEGRITTDTLSHKVVLSWTADYFQKPPREVVTDAIVSISDGQQTFALHEADSGIYLTDSTVFGEPGKTYTLYIQLADGSLYSGSEKLRYCNGFDSIAQSDNYNHLGPPGENNYGYDVHFYALEPEPAGDHYMFLLYLDDKLYTDTLFEAVFATDEFINGGYITDLPTHIIPEADFIGDSMKVTLEMQSMSREFYDYLTGLLLETVWRGSPWDGPPANVNGNISNGARGYFRAVDVKRKSRYFYATPRRDGG
jgi:hypothetical protein